MWTREQREIAKEQNVSLMEISLTGRGGKKGGGLHYCGTATEEEHKLVVQFLHDFLQLRRKLAKAKKSQQQTEG